VNSPKLNFALTEFSDVGKLARTDAFFLHGRLFPDEALFFDVLEQLFFCELPLELIAVPAGLLVQPRTERKLDLLRTLQPISRSG